MSEQTLTLTVAYGSVKHSVTLKCQDGQSPTVRDLAEALAEATGVHTTAQKLIFKGKSLKDPEESLFSYGIKEGCKMMLIGKRNSPEEEAELKKLRDIEKSVDQLAKKLEHVDGELTGIKNGFLGKDLQVESLGKLDNSVKVATEQLMKILEQLDAMSLPDNFRDCKLKRRGLANTVQDFLARCDKLEASISYQLSLIQSKNLALAD
ncbi:BAG family molecular chaperone regulator 1 [Thalassophryne amazonica]|uniref:BAG family molecular chaperone regulator 1 n=1 Tax=Thalassophryne amazonica TaxID=390379 RepID=UPI001472116D|nr:BAG family molecular chaperone regulator 1 [Thalassophryne amazonica]